ncbi:MAG: hypothetical protein ACYC7E_07670 [Armatimonadota bacterium]
MWQVADWERVRQRWEAFWELAIIDRPIVLASAPLPGVEPWTPPAEMTPEQRALDAEYLFTAFESGVKSTYFCGDSFPCYTPYLGAGVLAGYLGSPVEFAATTTWFHPAITSLENTPLPSLDPANRYWQATVELTREAAARAQGQYIVGITDLGGVTDVLASLLGTEALLFAMLETPEEVARWLAHLTRVWLQAYRTLVDLLPADNGTRGWLGYWSPKLSYPLQNDYSCMISPDLFRELCIPELEVQTAAMDHAFYHLDGPGATKHLDALLDLPRLRAIQWQPGTGGGTATEWLPLLKRIQAAGRGLFIDVRPYEFNTLMAELRPEGVICRVIGDANATPEDAEGYVAYLSRWV